tara:strand:- start:3728 stop:3907 length:180 start_codon:yes stop_codon:yes gene_type:complete
MKIKLAINNYETSNIEIYNLYFDNEEEFKKFDIEEYITENLNFSLSNIEYFIFNNIIEK